MTENVRNVNESYLS